MPSENNSSEQPHQRGALPRPPLFNRFCTKLRNLAIPAVLFGGCMPQANLNVEKLETGEVCEPVIPRATECDYGTLKYYTFDGKTGEEACDFKDKSVVNIHGALGSGLNITGFLNKKIRYNPKLSPSATLAMAEASCHPK